MSIANEYKKSSTKKETLKDEPEEFQGYNEGDDSDSPKISRQSIVKGKTTKIEKTEENNK